MNATAVYRCQGVLIGLAAGDRIGGPIRMAMHVAESLLACSAFNPTEILSRYLRWWREGAFDSGPVSARALELMVAGIPHSDAVQQVHAEFACRTAGCNPAHRSSPLSMLASIADDELHRCAQAEAALTHFDALAGEVAATVNNLCRSLIRGEGWDNTLQECGLTVPVSPGINNGFAPDVLRAAVYFVGTSADFGEALERSVSFAGAANYSPVLVGAIAGARWSALAIPASLLAHANLLPRVRAVAEALSATWNEPVRDPKGMD